METNNNFSSLKTHKFINKLDSQRLLALSKQRLLLIKSDWVVRNLMKIKIKMLDRYVKLSQYQIKNIINYSLNKQMIIEVSWNKQNLLGIKKALLLIKRQLINPVWFNMIWDLGCRRLDRAILPKRKGNNKSNRTYDNVRVIIFLKN